MAGRIKARTTLSIISGGYPGEDIGGTNEEYRNWKEIPESGVITSGYYFRDSDATSNADSSRVITYVEDSYSYTVDDNNVAHVTLTHKITSMARDDVHVSTITIGARNIRLWDKKGGTLLFQALNDPINTAHSLISNPITTETKTFTIAPGGHTSTNNSLFLRGNVPGHDSDPTPSIYVDECALGIEFLNDLPPDYRPGAILNTDGKWYSHNRSGGESHILLPNGKWREMRTLNGHSTNDNPPSIYRNGKWTDQLKIGKE